MNKKFILSICLTAVLLTVGLFDGRIMPNAYGSWHVTVTNNWSETVRIVPYYKCTIAEIASCGDYGMKEFPNMPGGGFLKPGQTETYTAPGILCVASVRAWYCDGVCVDRWTGCLGNQMDAIQTCCWNGNYEVVADKDWGWTIKRK